MILLDELNSRLKTDRPTMDDFTMKELNRAYMLIKIETILIEHPEIQIFSCNPEQAQAGPGPEASV